MTASMVAAFFAGASFAGVPDTDGDGIGDEMDTCPTTPNPSQTTPDTDGDGVPDACDNCLTFPNANQCDSNLDGYGNRCDQDLNNNGPIGFIDRAAPPSGFNPNFGSNVSAPQRSGRTCADSTGGVPGTCPPETGFCYAPPSISRGPGC